MRTELLATTMQQTLTPEAAAVLTRSIEEARRRRHGQTTPLHVAANLLSFPSGILRRACALSHPLLSSSHPLHCRALDLCFSVALDRLQANAGSGGGSDDDAADASPPLSNALVAAVKRAQAHQRRGCSDQQQPPLLAVKVELGQLVVSILDDPSVSRVMREAGFSSPAVKSAIEQSLFSGTNSPATKNAHMSPVLQKQGPESKNKGEVNLKKVLEIMTRSNKMNPVLVGESNAVALMKQLLEMIKNEELGMEAPATLRFAQVVSLEKEIGSLERSLIPRKISEFYRDLEPRIRAFPVDGRVGGLILYLGDLKWLVEGVSAEGGSSAQHLQVGRAAVAEMGRLLARLRERNTTRVWAVGTATCATYLRCQVYHPTMESEWDLQALPVAPPRSPLLAGRGFFPSSTPANAPSKFPTLEYSSCFQRNDLCPLCREGYHIELARLVSEERTENSNVNLSQWLQIALPCNNNSKADHLQKQRAVELLDKWRGKCARLHMSSHATVITSERILSGSISPPPNGSGRSPKLNSSKIQVVPVKTDLALGLSYEKSTNDSSIQHCPSISDAPDSQKRLLQGLTAAVSWQPEAASAIATALTKKSELCNGKLRLEADSWLLFSGPDKVGKRKMASALSELMFDDPPVTIHLSSPSADGDEAEPGTNFLGTTVLDRIAEAVSRNPLSVIVLDEIDRASHLAQEAIKSAIQRGRFLDSHGGEVNLETGSILFILILDWRHDHLKDFEDCQLQSEDKLLDSANSEWQLELSFCEKKGKRNADHRLSEEEEQPKKQKKPSLDLNLAVSVDDSSEEGSWNTSDLTVEQEHKHRQQLAIRCPTPSHASQLIDMVDATVVFKPVEFGSLRDRVTRSISSKITKIMGDQQTLQIDEEALDRIVGGVWQSGATNLFEEWTERVLVPGINQLRKNSDANGRSIVRLSSTKTDNQSSQNGSCARNCFPKSISIAINGT
ncbi:protein SUPPRESSOR OF MAX2 1-like [Curcuma longa]|uniref:protein SUPPRESSOR OF MAX2 1-like n=1 Tax=Curcuma longa TaxID=136217 RepID=UPI003D9EF275